MMMVAQRSPGLPYESLPTEDGGVPTSFTYRNGASHTPTVTHHPIPMGPHRPDRSTWITCTLVTVLVILASILGVIVGFAAQKANYTSAAGNTYPQGGGSVGEGLAPNWGEHGGYESGASYEETGEGVYINEHPETGVGSSNEEGGVISEDSGSSEDGDASSTRGSDESQSNSGENLSVEGSSSEDSSGEQASGSSQENISSESGESSGTDSNVPVVVATTKPATAPPTTTPIPTTTPTTPAPTTPPPTTPAPTTPAPTTPAPTTPAPTTPVTNATTPSTLGPIDEKESGVVNTTDDGQEVTTDDYDSELGVVDYMVVMQKELPVGLVLAILMAVILGTVGALAAIIYIVKRKTTTTRRRAHVRRAINELQAQDKSNLLQSDEEEG